MPNINRKAVAVGTFLLHVPLHEIFCTTAEDILLHCERGTCVGNASHVLVISDVQQYTRGLIYQNLVPQKFRLRAEYVTERVKLHFVSCYEEHKGMKCPIACLLQAATCNLLLPRSY